MYLLLKDARKLNIYILHLLIIFFYLLYIILYLYFIISKNLEIRYKVAVSTMWQLFKYFCEPLNVRVYEQTMKAASLCFYDERSEPQICFPSF